MVEIASMERTELSGILLNSPLSASPWNLAKIVNIAQVAHAILILPSFENKGQQYKEWQVTAGTFTERNRVRSLPLAPVLFHTPLP